MPWVTSPHSQSTEMPPLWLGPLQDCQWLRGGVVYGVDQVKQLDGPGISIQHVRSVSNGDLSITQPQGTISFHKHTKLIDLEGFSRAIANKVSPVSMGLSHNLHKVPSITKSSRTQ